MFLFRQDAQGDAALFGEFHGIAGVIEQGLLQPGGVAQQMRRQRLYVDCQAQALGLDARGQHGGDVAGDAPDIDSGFFQDEFVGFDLGQVEDGIDDFHQVFSGVFDLVQAFGLAGVGAGAAHQMRHAEDGVHRRADFMGHVGEECALGLIGGFGLVLGDGQLARALFDQFFQVMVVLAQFRLQALFLGDVAPDDMQQAARVLRNDREHDFDLKAATPGVQMFPFEQVAAQVAGARVHLQRFLVGAASIRLQFGRNGGGGHIPDLRPRVESEHGLRRAVAVDEAVFIYQQDGVGGIFIELAPACFAVRELRLRPLLFADVVHDGEDMDVSVLAGDESGVDAGRPHFAILAGERPFLSAQMLARVHPLQARLGAGSVFGSGEHGLNPAKLIDFLPTVTGQFAHGPVPYRELNPGRGVDFVADGDTVHFGVDDGFGEGGLAFQRQLHLLALGQIDMGADQSARLQGLSGGIARQLGAGQDVQPMALLVAHAEFDLEFVGTSFQIVGDQRQGRFPVVGMHQHGPGFQGLRQFAGGITQHLQPARRVIHRVVFQVPVPQAVIGAIQREGQALFALLQRRFGTLARGDVAR